MKKKGALLSVLVAACVACAAIVPIVALGNGDENKSGSQNGNNKYDSPNIGDIVSDGSYPDEKSSEASSTATEKEWYEYVMYSKTPYYQVTGNKERVNFYDPYDYNYGMVMDISAPKNEFGDYYDSEGYTTANEISVTYTKSKSTTMNTPAYCSSSPATAFGRARNQGSFQQYPACRKYCVPSWFQSSYRQSRQGGHA